MKKKILVVDDEPHIRRALSYVLGKVGYDVAMAKNGAEALEMAGEFSPALIFLDVMMSEIDGFEVCKRLKQSPEYKHIYIIMLTAKGQMVDEEIGLASGADEYVTKPFSPSKIVARVKEVIGESCDSDSRL